MPKTEPGQRWPGFAASLQRELRACLQRSSRVLFPKETQDFGRWNVICNEGLADAVGEDEGELAALHLLVLADRIQQHLGRRQFALNIAHARWQANRLQ